MHNDDVGIIFIWLPVLLTGGWIVVTAPTMASVSAMCVSTLETNVSCYRLCTGGDSQSIVAELNMLNMEVKPE